MEVFVKFQFRNPAGRLGFVNGKKLRFVPGISDTDLYTDPI